MRCRHILIATDTYQCKIVADIIKKKLELAGAAVDIPTFEGLNTQSRDSFERGVDEILQYMDNCLPGYREQRYKIVFNLTGGFKAVIGYLHLVAMFHADEILYIFEKDADLIRIPRLPIEIDESKLDENAIKLMALLENSRTMTVARLQGVGITTDNLYEGLFETTTVDGQDYISLNKYGKIVWEKLKEKQQHTLIDLPYIVCAQRFQDSFEKNRGMENFQKRTLERLALISSILVEENFDMGKLRHNSALQYEGLGNGVGHFRIDNAEGYRAICVPRDSKLVLIDCGRHELNARYGTPAAQKEIDTIVGKMNLG